MPLLSDTRTCSPVNSAPVTSVEVWTTPPAASTLASASALPGERLSTYDDVDLAATSQYHESRV